MDKTTAQRLVRETFKAAFDKKRYRDFINELCNGIDESKAIPSMGVPDAFAPHIKSCQRLGTFASPDGELTDVLVVQLTESYKLERTRTALRDFVAHKLKRDESYKEAGLVAFVAPDAKSWRFSYVRMEYETKRDPKTGKIKPEERLTPARRYSYLVGAEEECHTAQTRFLALLQNTNDKPTLADIEEAFSVESVTEEFFREYVRLFEDTEAALAAVVKRDQTIRDDFKEKGVTTIDFAKKLLGQIVFLYFIQKKGWLGVAKGGNWGDGPRNFLRQLADRAIGDAKCLFNDVLEPLFYDTLATDRGHAAWCKIFACRIPFLNGGLFEPLAGYEWKKTNIDLPNALFTNTTRSAAGDTGTGILDVFDRYNFTVNEAEPLEHEVAIDPEMLGKVFENLIEDNRRKGLGAFYTPREIVHFMCQESLINYLDTGLREKEPRMDTDETRIAGKEMSIRENPCSSVAKILRSDLETWIRQSDQFAHYAAAIAAGTRGDHYPKPPDSIRQFAREIDALLRDITVCDPAIGSGAFPVGMMTEIVRARMALTPYFNDVAERTAYHFKRHVIQASIHGVDIDPGAVEIAKLRLWLSLVVDEDDVQQIKPLPNLDYKIVSGNSLLGVEKTLFNNEQFKRLEYLKPKFFNESNREKKATFKVEIEDLIHELTNGRETFDFEIYFSEVFHCKSKFDIVIGNPPWGSKLTPDDKNALKAAFPLIDSSTPNSFAYFIGLAHRIAHSDFAYVLPDSLLMKDFAKTRKLIAPYLSELHWFQNIGVPDAKRPFLNVEHDVCALIARNIHSSSLLCSTTFYDPSLREMVCERWSASKNQIILEEFDYVFNLMLRQEDLSILEKIKAFPRIDTFVQCHEGIHTGNARDILFKERKENKSCKPLFYGGGAGDVICNYASRRAGWFVDYRQEIVDKRKGYYASLRDERIFTQPKIYLTRTGNPFKAFLDEDSYASNNFFSLQLADYEKNGTEPLKVILPFILSPLAQYFIRRFAAPRIGNTFVETKIVHLLKFRIPQIAPSVSARLLRLVEQVISEKSDEITKDTSQYELEINHLVYALYGLTPEEIQLIEGAQK